MDNYQPMDKKSDNWWMQCTLIQIMLSLGSRGEFWARKIVQIWPSEIKQLINGHSSVAKMQTSNGTTCQVACSNLVLEVQHNFQPHKLKTTPAIQTGWLTSVHMECSMYTATCTPAPQEVIKMTITRFEPQTPQQLNQL